MNNARLNRILKEMDNQKIPQLLVTDPASIFYLTGKWICPGERLLALYLNLSGRHKMIINRLFPQKEDLGVELVWYDDIEDGVEIISRLTERDKAIGIDKLWPARFLLRLQELHGAKCYVNGSRIIDDVRMIKDEEEQSLMRQAAKANDQIMEKLVGLANKGYTERELNNIACRLYAESGHSENIYKPITAYGKSAADPHHVTDETRGKRGDCVLFDIGGCLNGYYSDMTRTVFLEKISEKAKEIYEIVREAQLRGIKAARPGNRMCDVDYACRSYIEEKGYGEYFTHRTGHSIGIEPHETGDVSAVNQTIIRPGQIFSVEPGIYLGEEELGVRIEDLVLITETGCEVLTHYTKELKIV